MAVKYRIEYDNVKGDIWRLDIFNNNYTGDVIDVQGSISVENPEVDSLFTVIKGTGLQIKLEANTSQNFNELVGSEITDYEVRLYKNGASYFIGFLDPEGVFEDYVNDNWILTLNAVDGLGLLEDLSYVNEQGQAYLGKEKDINIINNCLKRIGRRLVINTSVNTRYFGLDSDLDPLDNVYTNNERFYKDDALTPMSCKEVLESILKKYGAVIVQKAGQWQIFCPAELTFFAPRWFYQYFSGLNSAVLANKRFTIYQRLMFGSLRGGNYPHWASANQQKRLEPAKSSFRLNYVYGFVRNQLSNPLFLNNGSTLNGGWTVSSPIEFTSPYINTPGRGVNIPPNSNAIALTQSDNITIAENLQVKVFIRFLINTLGQGDFFARLRLTDGATTYYLEKNGNWNTSQRFLFTIGLGGVEFANEYTSDPAPIAGSLIFDIYSRSTYDVVVYEASISAVENSSAQGETFTASLDNPTSKRIVENDEVIVGDNLSDVYSSALYENDQDTNTFTWVNSINPFISGTILKMLAETVLSFNRFNRTIFEGGFYGDLDIDSIYNIENQYVDEAQTQLKDFMVISRSFNTKTNEGQAIFKELGSASSSGITTITAIQTGDVPTPTIK